MTGGATTCIEAVAVPGLPPADSKDVNPLAEIDCKPATTPTTSMVNEHVPLPPSEPPVKVRVVAPATAVGGTPQAPLKPFGVAIFNPGARFAVKLTAVSGTEPVFAKLKVRVLVGKTVADDSGIWLSPKDTLVKMGRPNCACAVPADSTINPAIKNARRLLFKFDIRNPLLARELSYLCRPSTAFGKYLASCTVSI